MKSETKQLARALAKELLTITNFSICEWITEEKLLAELPFSKRMLQTYRSNGLITGYHFKALNSKEKPLGNSDNRGRKVFIYHRSRILEFVEEL
ncbi:excisionase family protein [Chitinophaga nivalis]|uniref:excisionase family protein n=2 Tax=Chitinophaga nivalis TaxID=2991709 RepID=UPI00353081B9